MQSYWDKTGLVNIRTHVAKGRVHPEWRLIASVISFCSGAGLATSLWDFSILTSSGAVGVSITSLLALLAVGFKKRCLRTTMFVLLFSCCSGLLVGQLRLISVKQSYVATTSYADIEGVVERFQIGESGLARLLMKPTKIGKKVISLPAKLRVSIRTAVDPEVRAGRMVSFSAKLAAPNGPMVPGGYNFSRTAFFSGIGAEAIAVSPVKALSANHGSGFEYWIIEKREQIEAQLLQYISGQAGGVAVALTVGFRNHLSPKTTETLRRAGLSHLLAISGLHMGLITGASFFIFEFLFAAFPMAALSVMPRKLAVLPAWLVAISYLFLSGASISTIRAFIMVSVGLLAIVTGRKVVSLRSVALAAFFITLWKPESVLSIGFQMSFAATIGLVAFYENARKDNVGWLKYRENWFTKLLSYIAAIAVTSIVAQLSVAPFSLFHFQSISAAGVIANVVALPVVSFWVMPSLLLGVFSEAIGGLQLLSGVIKVGLDVVLNVAAETSALPYSLLYVAPISIGIFITAVFSLLLLLVYRSALSYGLVVAILLIFVFAQIQTKEGVLISRSGHTLMAHTGDTLYVRGGRKNSFRNRVWAQYWGKNHNEVGEPLTFYCDESGCGYDLLGNQSFSLQRVKAMPGIRRACVNQNIVIIPDRYARYCRGASILIKENTLERQGPLALLFDKENNITLKWSNP